jgi:hypothetical protein
LMPRILDSYGKIRSTRAERISLCHSGGDVQRLGHDLAGHPQTDCARWKFRV